MSEVQFIPKKVVTVIEPKRSTVVDKEKYRQKRVAAYCRVSTGSDEQLNSYETQKAVYSEMIASRTDWCLAGIQTLYMEYPRQKKNCLAMHQSS